MGSDNDHSDPHDELAEASLWRDADGRREELARVPAAPWYAALACRTGAEVRKLIREARTVRIATASRNYIRVSKKDASWLTGQCDMWRSSLMHDSLYLLPDDGDLFDAAAPGFFPNEIVVNLIHRARTVHLVMSSSEYSTEQATLKIPKSEARRLFVARGDAWSYSWVEDAHEDDIWIRPNSEDLVNDDDFVHRCLIVGARNIFLTVEGSDIALTANEAHKIVSTYSDCLVEFQDGELRLSPYGRDFSAISGDIVVRLYLKEARVVHLVTESGKKIEVTKQEVRNLVSLCQTWSASWEGEDGDDLHLRPKNDHIPL